MPGVEREAVPHQVQPAAGPEFGEHDRPLETGQRHMGHGDQRGTAAHFVGLGRAFGPVDQEILMRFQGAEHGPFKHGVAAGVGRIGAAQGGVALLQHQRV